MKTNTQKRLNLFTFESPDFATSCGAILASTAILASPVAAQSVPDRKITNALESALLFESAVPTYLIDISVTDGIATLKGTVSNILAKERAVKAAKAVRGVRAVVDKINLDLPDIEDETIKDNVVTSLALDPATDSYEIDVSVSDGKVTLTGTTDSWQEKELVAHVAKGVTGVGAVNNEIVHQYDTERADSEIKAEVERALEIDVLLRPLLITVDVSDDIVTLSGSVGSATEKDRATSVAWVNGVKDVAAEDLTVDSWASSDDLKNELPKIKDDEKIKEAVLDAFAYDPRVFSFNPEVSVSNGVVTLTGTVDNLKAKNAAERDARNTVGAWRVKNFLKVRTAEPSQDDTVETDLETALAFNATVESYEIDVTVDDGVATLDGTVDSYFEKNEAADVASRTNGVIAIRNNLNVDYPELSYYSYSYDPLWSTPVYYGYNTEGEPTWPAVTDAEIIEDIGSEFFWSPFVDGGDINITADQGEVTLTGTVDDYSEFRAATENAYEGGASEVINKLEIE